jgi:hypothetical protein
MVSSVTILAQWVDLEETMRLTQRAQMGLAIPVVA